MLAQCSKGKVQKTKGWVRGRKKKNGHREEEGRTCVKLKVKRRKGSATLRMLLAVKDTLMERVVISYTTCSTLIWIHLINFNVKKAARFSSVLGSLVAVSTRWGHSQKIKSELVFFWYYFFIRLRALFCPWIALAVMGCLLLWCSFYFASLSCWNALSSS